MNNPDVTEKPETPAASTPASGSARWEREFYNSYGNYSGFRFQDWCGRCPHLDQTGTYWHCHHPDRKGEGKYVHCELRDCPCVEIDGDEDEYLEWSDCETPVLVKAQNADISDRR